MHFLWEADLENNATSGNGTYAMASKGKERKHELKKLRLKGNFQYNVAVIASGKGQLIVARRGKTEKPSSSYLPCRFCLGFYRKEELWRHCKTCDFKSDDPNESEPDHADAIRSGKWLVYGSCIPQYIEQDLAYHVISTLSDDDISEIAKTDSLIIQLGNAKLKKLGFRKAPIIRQYLRQVARILIETRNITKRPKINMMELISPKHYDTILKATENICEPLDGRSLTGCVQYKKPGLALNVGHSPKKLALLKEGMAIRNSNSDACKDAADFIKLHDREWCDKVASHAHQTLRERKYNKPELLPMTDDLKKLKEYQVTSMETYIQTVKSEPTFDNWRKLALVTLGRISLFNKRREAEVGEMLLSVYMEQAGKPSNPNKDMM